MVPFVSSYGNDLKGVKGISPPLSRLEKGITGFVTFLGTMVLGIQSDILIRGSDTFFFPETVFIAQSRIFAFAYVNSRCLFPIVSKSPLLLI